MTTSLIVAKYNESIEWLNDVSNLFNRIYLYNKGVCSENECLKCLDTETKTKIVYKELPNVGREGHTYLWHVLNRRDELEDKLIFTQAEPFDHLIKRQRASVDYFKDVCKNYLSSDKYFQGFGCKHYVWRVGLRGRRELLIKLHKELFETKFVSEYKFNNGGIFGVSKKAVLTRTDKFYKHIMNTPISQHINPHEGFVLERLWVLIFNESYISTI